MALLSFGIARGAAPSYSALDIVNATNFTPGPFAPNSILALFGANLAPPDTTAQLTSSDIVNDTLPANLAGTEVFVGYSPGSGGPSQPAPLYYVGSDQNGSGQVNFILPAGLCPSLPCSVAVRLTTNSNSGPIVNIDVVAAVPALFPLPNYPGFVIATNGDSDNLITPDSPAHAGDIAVLYMTGLGKTVTDPEPGQLPNYTSPLADLANLKITLGSVSIDPTTLCPAANGAFAPCIQYAGLAPLEAALYQINLTIPPGIAANPAIQVWMGAASSPAGMYLAVQ